MIVMSFASKRTTCNSSYAFADALLSQSGFFDMQAYGHKYACDYVVGMVCVAGVILDPVYSGKAYHTLLEEIKQHPEQWAGRKVLFLHTGGLFGMYDKVTQLQPMLEKLDKADRMHVSL